jgi:hypothetical protein
MNQVTVRPPPCRADTSVRPDVARKAAEDVATLIIAAECLVPGTTRPSQPERPGDRRVPQSPGRSGTRPYHGQPLPIPA